MFTLSTQNGNGAVKPLHHLRHPGGKISFEKDQKHDTPGNHRRGKAIITHSAYSGNDNAFGQLSPDGVYSQPVYGDVADYLHSNAHQGYVKEAEEASRDIPPKAGGGISDVIEKFEKLPPPPTRDDFTPFQPSEPVYTIQSETRPVVQQTPQKLTQTVIRGSVHPADVHRTQPHRRQQQTLQPSNRPRRQHQQQQGKVVDADYWKRYLEDPVIRKRIEATNNTEPRFIKKKLCEWGVHCGGKSYGHHGIHPDDITYVQPIKIVPVGGSIPAIVHGGKGIKGGFKGGHIPYGGGHHGHHLPPQTIVHHHPRPPVHYGSPPVQHHHTHIHKHKGKRYGRPHGHGGGGIPVSYHRPVGPVLSHGSSGGSGSASGGGTPVYSSQYAGPQYSGYGREQVGEGQPIRRQTHQNIPPPTSFNILQMNPHLQGSIGQGSSYTAPNRLQPSGKAIDCICVPPSACRDGGFGNGLGRQLTPQINGLDPRHGTGKRTRARGTRRSKALQFDSEDKETDKEAKDETKIKLSTNSTDSDQKERRKRDTESSPPASEDEIEGKSKTTPEKREVGGSTPRQNGYGGPGTCASHHVCCFNPIGSAESISTSTYGTCGRRNAHGIVGRIKELPQLDGDAEFGEYPWQAVVLKKRYEADGSAYDYNYVCGATLIDGSHVITAAHCVKGHKASDLRVRLGEWDVNHETEIYPYDEKDVSAVFVHPDYYAGNLYNDVAVLKLISYVDFRYHPHISPACMPELHQDFTGQRCFVTGWGKDNWGQGGRHPTILKEVDVPIIGHQDCEARLRRTRLSTSFQLHKGFLCAGGEPGRDACEGDGGGPLVCEHQGVWQLAGVISWGIGCGQPGVPGVYVKVSEYLPWIAGVVTGGGGLHG